MGYRLEISKMKHVYCAGKFYGYESVDAYNSKSVKWLLDNKFIKDEDYEGEVYWGYDFNPQIVLNAKQFEEYIKLYNEDLNEFGCQVGNIKDALINDEEMKNLIADRCNKVLEWF